jgi:hypothetical protein
MNNNKMIQISNPMLIGAMELIKKNKSPETLKVFMDEVLHARFLAPIVITPPPVADENGKVKLTEENKISIPMVSGPDGRKFFLAYTDMGELSKMKLESNMSVMGFNFNDYAIMVAKSDEKCDGFVINPQSNGPIVNKNMVATIMNTVLKKKQEKEE